MKKLFLMRHVETEFNVQNRIQGRCDSPITEKGLRQACKVKEFFENNDYCFDHTYSSVSDRAYNSLKLIVGNKYPYSKVNGLQEWDFGSFEGKDCLLQPKFPFGDFYKQYGGETQKELTERVVNTLFYLIKMEENKDILVVSHYCVCALFYEYWRETSLISDFKRINNGMVFFYQFEADKFTCFDLYDPQE